MRKVSIFLSVLLGLIAVLVLIVILMIHFLYPAKTTEAMQKTFDAGGF